MNNQTLETDPKGMTLCGYINEVRISNYARWATNFVSPINLDGCLEIWKVEELK